MEGGGTALTWDIVYIAAIHQQVAIFGVAERRQVRGVGGTRPNIAPDTACRMDMEHAIKMNPPRPVRDGAAEEEKTERQRVGERADLRARRP